jgi:hypothetical protein
MASISLTPITLTDATLLIGADEYAAAADRVEFTPQVEIAYLDPPMSSPTTSQPVVRTVRWSCQVEYAQDVLTTDSLTRYLLSHIGERRSIVFAPHPGTGQPVVTADVLVIPGRIGGSADDGVLTATTELPLFGSPVLAAAGA